MIKYAGIGARKTPEELLPNLSTAAASLAKAGVGLRTGGSWGADQAFYDGWKRVEQDELVEIFVPYSGFRGFVCTNANRVFGPPSKEAKAIAREFHPNWANVGDTGRMYLARNVYQILGFDLESPSDFVLCWTPDGKEIGGTSQGIRIAHSHSIPVINLGNTSLEEANDRIQDILEG